MKQLLLIRHAKSCWDDVNLNDIDRPLNKRGKKESSELGKLLKKKELFPQLIISSPAKRASKTALKISKELDYAKENIQISDIIYSDNVSEMAESIHLIDNKIDRVFIIGHYPSLMELGNFLTGSSFEKFLTSGFMLINFNVKKWKEVRQDTGKVVMLTRVK